MYREEQPLSKSVDSISRDSKFSVEMQSIMFYLFYSTHTVS